MQNKFKSNRVFLLILIFVLIILGFIYFTYFDKEISANRCLKKGGEIVNNLEGNGCEPGCENIGSIGKNFFTGNQLSCPCICCVTKNENNTVEKNSSESQNQNPLTQATTTQDKVSDKITSTKNYKNTDYGYSVDYPTDWQLPTINESTSGDLNFGIQNIPDSYTTNNIEVLPKNNASGIGISVNTFFNGISYSNYSTIEDFIKDPRFVKPSAVQGKLDYVSSMNIGGQNLKVMIVESDKGVKYQFIFKGKFYNISFGSGSSSQYSIDYPTFEKLLSSFTLL